MSRLLEHFIVGSTARIAASLIGVNRNMASKYYHEFRQVISNRVEDDSPVRGEIEANEFYFGGKWEGK